MAISEDRNRLYVGSSAKPGITLWQIARCLRDYRKSRLGTDLGLLCTSPNINKWAKHKPVRSADTERGENTYKAHDGWCGLDVSNALVASNADLSGIAAKYDGSDNGWRHAAPRGCAFGELFRRLDFDGYNHKATPFVGKMTIPAKWAKSDGNFQMNVVFAEPTDDGLSYRDFPSLQDYYLGIALVGSGGTKRCTSGKTIGESGMSVQVDASYLSPGAYMAYPFISNTKLTMITANGTSAMIYTLPNNSGTAIEILSAGISVRAVATKDIIRSRIAYTFTVTNNLSAPCTLTNNVVRLRYDNKAYDDILVANEVSESLGEITVAGNSEHTSSGSFSVNDATLLERPKIWVWLNGGEYIMETIPMQDTSIL